jgi:acyl-CoA dehydrogenase
MKVTHNALQPASEAAAPMSFDFQEEHELLRENVRRFFAEELPEAKIREMDQARKVPKSLWKRFSELGWMGLSIPVEYGGSGADLTMGTILCEELSRQFPSLGTNYVIFSMAARAIREHGTAKQKAELLPRMARGEFMFAFGITEPSGGTDVLGLKTRAQLEGDEWIINGQKLFTTFADDADAILVVCRTDPPEENKRARGISLILAPRHQPGFTIRRLQLMGHRAACTCETFIENVRAPADGLLGERGRGWYHLLATLDEERILSAAIYVGIMDGVLAQAVQYAKDRTAFGRSIGAFQAVQHPIAEIATDLEHSRMITMKAAWLLSKGRECSKEAAMAKLFASEAAVRATDRGMRVLAGYGLVEESPMERLFRDARLGPFSPISNEMAKNFIGQRLGLPRSY